MEKNNPLNINKLSKGNPKIILAIAQTMLAKIKENTKYDSKRYGNVDDMINWDKNRLVRWISQFKPGLTTESKRINQSNSVPKKMVQNKVSNKIIEDKDREIAELKKKLAALENIKEI